jgi:uncharacterized membrane protein YhiD involved in acid resistance
MRHGASIKGLTTAASLWVVAALGMSVGVGYYLGAVTVAVLLLIVKLPGNMKAEQVVEELSGASGVTGAHWKR